MKLIWLRLFGSAVMTPPAVSPFVELTFSDTLLSILFKLKSYSRQRRQTQGVVMGEMLN